MSSFLFYSSPPSAPHQPQDLFRTPQASRSNLFATNHSRFQPKSPSPLRTSSNTGNVMRRYESASMSESDKHARGASGEELQEKPTDAQPWLSTPFLGGSSTNDASCQSLFAASSSTVTHNRNPSVFQQRASAASPATQMASRASRNRESHKAGFIDRLRRTRRDKRDTRGLETFEKAEYWREQREREARLRAEANDYSQGMLDVDEEENGAPEDGDTGMSPADEDDDVAGLVEAYYDASTASHVSDHRDYLAMEDEDYDYDAAFLEVLGQSESTTTDAPLGWMSGQQLQHDANDRRFGQQHARDGDLDMS